MELYEWLLVGVIAFGLCTLAALANGKTGTALLCAAGAVACWGAYLGAIPV